MDKRSFLKVFASIGPFIGPALLALRGQDASAFEKFSYVTMIGPLAIIAISLRYAEDKNDILNEPDSVTRQAHLRDKQIAFRKLLTIVLIASCVSAGTAAWLLLRSE